jgi:hypothetical protein
VFVFVFAFNEASDVVDIYGPVNLFNFDGSFVVFALSIGLSNAVGPFDPDTFVLDTFEFERSDDQILKRFSIRPFDGLAILDLFPEFHEFFAVETLYARFILRRFGSGITVGIICHRTILSTFPAAFDESITNSNLHLPKFADSCG